MAILGLVVLAVLAGAPTRGTTITHALGIPRPAVIAHRGASYLAPENTRPAFLLARELGVDYLELDLQRTRDGILVALHDHDLRRTTNVAAVFPGRDDDTLDTFLFSELQRLDAGSWFNERFPDRARASFRNLRILRLEEVIEIAEGGVPRPGIYIETKSAHRIPGIERQLVGLLTARGWVSAAGTPVPPGVIFQSFEAESLARFKEFAPQVPRLLLVDEVAVGQAGWPALLTRASEVAMGIGLWGHRWAYGPEWSAAHAPTRYLATWPWRIGQAHRAGLFVHPWTIDDRWEMWMVRLGGADGIFTDRCDVALAVYGRSKDRDLASLWRAIGY